jgi:hypothetical protein
LPAQLAGLRLDIDRVPSSVHVHRIGEIERIDPHAVIVGARSSPPSRTETQAIVTRSQYSVTLGSPIKS